MSEFVVIRLTAENESAEWIQVDGNGTRRSNISSGDLGKAAIEIGDKAVILLVPGEEILSTSINIPARSSAKIKAALPFALEEDLADDIEDLHFSIGTRKDDGRLPVAVVAREKMDHWLGALRSAGIEPLRVVADNHGLAKIPGTLSVLVDGDNVLFNDGADQDVVLQNIKPSDVLVLTGNLGEKQSDEESSGHLVAFCTQADESRLEHDWIALRHELHSVDVNVLPDGVLPKLAVTVAAGHGINLLQGSYGRKSDYGALFMPWRIAAGLGLALLLTGAVFKGVSYIDLVRQKEALRAQFTAEYREIRPGDSGEILDPQSTVDSLRRSFGSTAAPQVFLPSLREVGAALATSTETEIEAISYRAGVIDLRLTSPDVETLDNIQQSVSESGQFQATIQSTAQVADRINGRIQVRESGQ